MSFLLEPSSQRGMICFMEERDRRVAYHEAGHVVAHFYFRSVVDLQFEYVTIEPDREEGSAGHVKLIPSGRGIQPDLFDFTLDDEMNEEACGMTQRELEARMSILLAGEAATYVLDGRRDEHGTGREEWSGDYAGCMEFLERLFWVEDEAEATGNRAAHAYMEALFWRMAFTFEMSAWRNKLDLIAESLVKKRKLSAAECHSIYTAA